MSEKIKIPFICIYENYLDNFSLYSPEEVGNMVLALLTYLRTDEEPAFTGNERFLWPWLRQQLDRDREAYAKRCDANRKNGKLGGRPRKAAEEADPSPEESEETDGFSEEPKKPKNKDKKKNKNINKNNNKNSEKNNANDRDKERDNHKATDNECGANLFERTVRTLGKIPSAIGSPISFEQLCVYIEESGFPIDPVQIWNHYALNHWTTNGRAILDWGMEVKRWYRIQQLENAFNKS